MAAIEFASRCQRAVDTIKQLAHYDRYEGALVFGSFATGHLHAESDLDISILVTDELACANVSHPILDGIRVDISFNSLADLVKMTEETLQEGLRKPWLYDGLILFDKQGRLQQLKERALHKAQPVGKALEPETVQFEMYYRYTKPRKYLSTAPETANLIMHMQLAGLLRFHYQLRGQWWVSDKHIFTNLAGWDPAMGKLLQDFLNAPAIEEKYRLWTEMIDHVLMPSGGRNFGRLEASCDCVRCQADIQRLASLFAPDPALNANRHEDE